MGAVVVLLEPEGTADHPRRRRSHMGTRQVVIMEVMRNHRQGMVIPNTRCRVGMRSPSDDKVAWEMQVRQR